MAKYVFDSNIFMNLQRRQPIDIYPSMWNKLGELITLGIIISSQEVYDEIAVGGDDLEKHLRPNTDLMVKLLKENGYNDKNLLYLVDPTRIHHESTWSDFMKPALRFVLK